MKSSERVPGGNGVSAYRSMGREDLLRALEMFAKNWLAHDGCWFLAAEERFGMQTAIELDACSWARFAAVEARRIMAVFGAAGRRFCLRWRKRWACTSTLSSMRNGSPCKPRGHGGVRNIREGRRSTHLDEVSALSPGYVRGQALRLGIQHAVIG